MTIINWSIYYSLSILYSSILCIVSLKMKIIDNKRWNQPISLILAALRSLRMASIGNAKIKNKKVVDFFA